MIRFADNRAVGKIEPLIRAYLAEAMEYADAGIRPEKDEVAPDMPEELVEALDGDPELAEAFHALTPGRQKSYLINIGAAKKPETRFARIGKFRDRIIAGKGALER